MGLLRPGEGAVTALAGLARRGGQQSGEMRTQRFGNGLRPRTHSVHKNIHEMSGGVDGRVAGAK